MTRPQNPTSLSLSHSRRFLQNHHPPNHSPSFLSPSLSPSLLPSLYTLTTISLRARPTPLSHPLSSRSTGIAPGRHHAAPLFRSTTPPSATLFRSTTPPSASKSWKGTGRSESRDSRRRVRLRRWRRWLLLVVLWHG